MSKKELGAIISRGLGGVILENPHIVKRRFALRLILAVLMKINPNGDPSQLDNIVLDLAHVKIKLGVTGDDVMRELKSALMDLLSVKVGIDTDYGWAGETLIRSPRIRDATRLVTLNMDRIFWPELSKFHDYLSAKERCLLVSDSALHFYLRLKHKHSKKIDHYTFEKLQQDCHTNFSRFYDFKVKYLQPKIKELKDADINISFKEHRKGRRLEFLSFTVSEPERDNETPQIATEQPLSDPSPVTPPKETTTTSLFVINDVFEHYRSAFQPKQLVSNPKRNTTIGKAIEKYGATDCKTAIDYVKKAQKDNPQDQWLQDMTIDTLFAPSQIEKYINLAAKNKPKKEFTEEELKQRYFARLERYEQTGELTYD